MSIKITRGLSFLFWTLLIIISISGLIITYMFIKDIFIGDPFSALFFLFSWFCIIIASISVYKIVFNFINKKDKGKDLEENINEFIRYQNITEPPDTQMYN